MSESLLSPFLSFRYLYFCLFVSFSSSKFVSALLESFGAFLGVKGQNVQGWDGMDFSSQSIVPGFVPFTNDGILSSSQNTARIKLLEGFCKLCHMVGNGKCLSDLRTHGIAVSKSAVQVQFRHLAVWLMLLLLLKTQPLGHV